MARASGVLRWRVVEVDAKTQTNAREAPSGLQLIVMAEAGSQRVDLPRGGTVTLGRGETADVRIDDVSISRSHAALHVRNTIQLEDLGSSNGTFLHGARIQAGDPRRSRGREFFEVGSVVCVVRGLDNHDRLRQLRTHEHFEARLQDETSRARRTGNHPAVIRIRSDDDEGEVVATILGIVRPGDVVARYAPGEYEVLLIDAESTAAAELTAQLARKIEATFGVAVHPHDGGVRRGAVRGGVPRARSRVLGVGRRRADPRVADDAPAARAARARRGRRCQRAVARRDRCRQGGVRVALARDVLPRRRGAGEAQLRRVHRHAARQRAVRPREGRAFTGADRRKLGLLESATGGMVFLDEIGELEASAQAKLLRVIEDRQVRRVGGLESIAIDVGFVAATNRDLADEVAAKRFRADLYYRLNGFTVTIPPRRERREEIFPRARPVVAAAAGRLSLPVPPALSDDAIALLATHRWSGNIRELRNMMDRAVLLSGGGSIQPEHLPVENLRSETDALERSLARASADSEVPPGLTDDERVERDHIIATLASVYGNQTRAAELLAISRRWLTTKMARYRIPRPRKR